MFAAEVLNRFLHFQNHHVFCMAALTIQTEDDDNISIYQNMYNLMAYNLEKSFKNIKSFDLSLLLECVHKTDIKKLVPNYEIMIDEILGDRRLIVIRHHKTIMSHNL